MDHLSLNRIGYQMRFKLKALWNHWTIQDFNEYAQMVGPNWQVITQLLNRKKPMEKHHFQALAYHVFEIIITKLIILHHFEFTQITEDQIAKELNHIFDSHIIPEEWSSSLCGELEKQYLQYCEDIRLMIDDDDSDNLGVYIVPTYLNYIS
jgi:hypothetical protein